MARPGFVREAAQARLHAAGQPLARRSRRMRDRIGQRLAGSGFVHALVLVLLSVMFAAQHEGGNPPQQAPVEMMYERPGSAGMVGVGSPDAGASAPTAKPVPDLRPPVPTPPAEPPPVPETAPLPEMQVPEPLPKPSPEPPRTTPQRQAERSSPLSNPMNLSFSQAPTPQRSRRARPGGSGAPIDMSLGPVVQGGHLMTPYASATSIKGVSDDYADEIGAWIRRHMYYPEEAARRGEDGPSHVHVVLDRQGRVNGIRLVTSSGSFLLDDATQGMFRNATLPPVPPDMSGNSFDVDLTIDYILIRH